MIVFELRQMIGVLKKKKKLPFVHVANTHPPRFTLKSSLSSRLQCLSFSFKYKSLPKLKLKLTSLLVLDYSLAMDSLRVPLHFSSSSRSDLPRKQFHSHFHFLSNTSFCSSRISLPLNMDVSKRSSRIIVCGVSSTQTARFFIFYFSHSFCLVAVTAIINLFLSNWRNQFNIEWTLIMASVMSQLRGLFFLVIEMNTITTK